MESKDRNKFEDDLWLNPKDYYNGQSAAKSNSYNN